MGRVVVVVGMVAVLLAALSWSGSAALIPRDDAFACWAVALQLVAAALALLRPAPLRVVAVPVAVGGLIPVVVTIRAAVGTGLPSPAVGGLAAGALVTTVGVVVRAVSARRAPSGAGRLRRRWTVTAAAGLAAVGIVVGVSSAVNAAAWAWPVVSTPATAGDAPAPVVEVPGGVAWEYDDPVPSRAVLPAGAGVVVARADGIVVAVDGRTGRARWSAGRRGSEIAVTVTPDRRTVLVEQSAGRGTSAEGGSSERQLLVLDADTGTTRWEAPLDGLDAVTDDVLVAVGRDQVTTRSVTDGAPRWSTPLPAPGCTPEPATRTVAADAAVLAWACPEPGALDRPVRLQGLDAATGRPRWTLRAGDVLPVPSGNTPIRSASDGTVLVWDTVVVDPATGAWRAALDETTRAVLPPGSLPVALAESRSLSGSTETTVAGALAPTGPVRVPPSRCTGTELAVTVTPRATVRMCRGPARGTGNGPPSMQVDDAEPVRLPVDPAPAYAGTSLGVGDGPASAFAVPAPGAFVVGGRKLAGTTLVGLR